MNRLHIIVQGHEIVSQPFNAANANQWSLTDFPVVEQRPREPAPQNLPQFRDHDPRIVVRSTPDVVIRYNQVGAWWLAETE